MKSKETCAAPGSNSQTPLVIAEAVPQPETIPNVGDRENSDPAIHQQISGSEHINKRRSKVMSLKSESSNGTTSHPEPADKLCTQKDEPRMGGLKELGIENETFLERLKEFGIEFRDDIHGKPVFVVQSDSVINLDSEFAHKKLCDGPTFTTGHACVFSCEFCYVKSVLCRNKKICAILKETGLGFEDIIIELADPAKVAWKFLSDKSKPKFNDPNDQRVIFGSPLVDVAATMGHVKQTVAVCLAILKLTHWQIRLLSKSSLLPQIAKGLPEEFKSRVIYGLSTGTLDDGMARVFEKGTPFPSKRIEALHGLQDNGFRTFGMPCPILPQRDYDKFAAEMAATIRVDQCEHVWAEVLNSRGDSLTRTASALRQAGFGWEADQLENFADDGAAREKYARNTFEAFAKVVPAGKLRFLQYTNEENYGWWKERENDGAILLGAYVNKLNGKGKAPAKPLSEAEKELWSECQKGVRRNFKACFGAYVQLGAFLTKIRDQRLYREEYRSFETYCHKELEIARSTAYGYISDYALITELSEISDTSKLTKEIHLRPIISLQETERQQAIALLKDKTGEEPLTPGMLVDVAAEVIAMRPPPTTEPNANNGAGPHVNGYSPTEPIMPAPVSPEADMTESTAGEVNRIDLVTSDSLSGNGTGSPGHDISARQPADSTPVPLAVFTAAVRRIVKTTQDKCPGQALEMARELRAIADRLEQATHKSNQSTVTE